MTKHFAAPLLTVDSAFHLERLVFTVQKLSDQFPPPSTLRGRERVSVFGLPQEGTQVPCAGEHGGAQSGTCGSDAALTLSPTVRLSPPPRDASVSWEKTWARSAAAATA